VGERIEQVEQRIDTLEVTMRGDIKDARRHADELADTLREEIIEVRRHAEVLHETLRDDIRMLAEGFATLSTKIDTMERRP
jgi:predicted  nucleic acid-binding Zn-ribbon protein